MKNCWICNNNIADSKEHIIKKSTLDLILGKPSTTRKKYFHRYKGKKNTPVSGYKNNHFTFKKNICKNCNNSLTQPYDYSFDIFIKNLFKYKSVIVNRQSINLLKLCGSPDELKNLSLYFYKSFGCMIVDQKIKISSIDFENIKKSLLSTNIQPVNLFLSFHQDIKKLSLKKGTVVSQFPSYSDIGITWTIDLDWISLILSYPYELPPRYGQCWNISKPCKKVLLGKLL